MSIAQFSRATAMLLVFVAVAGVPLSSDPTALVELERMDNSDTVVGPATNSSQR